MTCDHCGQDGKLCGQADGEVICVECIRKAKEKDVVVIPEPVQPAE